MLTNSSNSASLWIRVRLQYALVRELQYEISLNPIAKTKIAASLTEKLADLLSAPLVNLLGYEEMIDIAAPTLSSYFLDDQHKNILSVLKHTEPALSALRIKVKSYFIDLNSLCFKYEPIKEQFKR